MTWNLPKQKLLKIRETWKQEKWEECYVHLRDLVHDLWKKRDPETSKDDLVQYLLEKHAIPWGYGYKMPPEHPLPLIIIKNNDALLFYIYVTWDFTNSSVGRISNIGLVLPTYLVLSKYDCTSLARVMMQIPAYVTTPLTTPHNESNLTRIIMESTANFLLTIFDFKDIWSLALHLSWMKYLLERGNVQPLERLFHLKLFNLNHGNIWEYLRCSLHDLSVASLKLVLEYTDPDILPTSLQIFDMIVEKGTKDHLAYFATHEEYSTVFNGAHVITKGRMQRLVVYGLRTVVEKECRGGYPLVRYLCDHVSRSQLFSVMMTASSHFQILCDWNTLVFIGSKLGVCVHYSVFTPYERTIFDGYLFFLINLLTRRLTCKQDPDLLTSPIYDPHVGLLALSYL